MTLESQAMAAAQFTKFDSEMMALSLQLAERGQYTARPNPMVGCVLVKDQRIVGQGWHQRFGEPHAEINALAQAGEQARGATCYVTLEPCAHFGKTGPCANALIDAGVQRVVAAMQDPNPKVAGGGFQLLQAAGIETAVGLMESQAKTLNRGFLSRITRNRPWVTCKLAMSLDGRTALASGASQWITGAAARRDVQRLRARQDAIITGIGTVLNDNPSLTVRADDTEPGESWFQEASDWGFSQPRRILLDRQQRASLDAKIFNDDSRVMWVSDEKTPVTLKSHIEAFQFNGSLADLLTTLAQQEVGNLLVEAGHRLAGAFLEAQLIDELVVYMAPQLMGDRALGLFDLNIQQMQDARRLTLTDLRQFGDDLRLSYKFE